MSWFFLFVAGLFEIAWSTGLKHSQGFTRLWPSAFTVITMMIIFFLLAQAMKSLPLGTAYAVWTGIGTAGAVVMGIIIFNDPLTMPRMICLLFIIIGIAGLKILT